MKYLILPDVHNRIKIVEEIIAKVKPDKTIFLGDYYDDFYDNADIIKDIALWFRESVHREDRIHLLGNHDVHYWFNENVSTRCSGYEYGKAKVIDSIVKKEDFEKLRFFYVLDDKFILSHAGIHPVWVMEKGSFNCDKVAGKDNGITFKKVVNRLKTEARTAVKTLYDNRRHWMAEAGFSRGGRSHYGGLLWNDWNQDFAPIRGIHQIVGHTPCRILKWCVVGEGEDSYKMVPYTERASVNVNELTDNSSFNFCLDSHPGSQYFAIYEDGKFSVHKTESLN